MKTLQSRIVKSGDFKGEKLKIKELNTKEQKEYNCKYVVTLGEYDDIDHETENLKEAIEFYNDFEN